MSLYIPHAYPVIHTPDDPSMSHLHLAFNDVKCVKLEESYNYRYMKAQLRQLADYNPLYACSFECERRQGHVRGNAGKHKTKLGAHTGIPSPVQEIVIMSL